MGLIYKRTSPSGKYYIGKTIDKEYVRWTRHIQEAKDNTSNTYNTLLSNAIRKYGENNFKLTILEDNIPIEILGEKEQYYIEKYHAYYKDPPYLGYNMTRGGDGAYLYTDDEILQEWDDGFNINQISERVGATRQTIRKRLQCLGIDIELRKERRSEIIKEVTRFSKDFQKIIVEKYLQLQNIDKVAQELNLSNETVRKYLNYNNIKPSEMAVKRRQKPVYQINKNTKEIIKLFDSARQAAEILFPANIESARRSILHAAKNNLKGTTAYGYEWMYKEHTEE